MWRRLFGHEGGGRQGIDRRIFLRRAVVGGTVFGCLDQIAGSALVADEPKLSPAEEAERELARAQSLVRVATRSPLITARSEQFLRDSSARRWRGSRPRSSVRGNRSRLEAAMLRTRETHTPRRTA